MFTSKTLPRVWKDLGKGIVDIKPNAGCVQHVDRVPEVQDFSDVDMVVIMMMKTCTLYWASCPDRCRGSRAPWRGPQGRICSCRGSGQTRRSAVKISGRSRGEGGLTLMDSKLGLFLKSLSLGSSQVRPSTMSTSISCFFKSTLGMPFRWKSKYTSVGLPSSKQGWADLM